MICTQSMNWTLCEIFMQNHLYSSNPNKFLLSLYSWMLVCRLPQKYTKMSPERRTFFFSTGIVKTSHNTVHLANLWNLNQICKEILNSKMNLFNNHKYPRMIFKSMQQWRKNEVEYERSHLWMFMKDSKLFWKYERTGGLWVLKSILEVYVF